MTELSEMFISISEGNEDTLKVLVLMINNQEYSKILLLNSMNIKGEQIWRLYKDCSDENFYKFIRTIDVLKYGGYTKEEIRCNLTTTFFSVPFLYDEVLEDGYPNYNETFKETDIKWDEYIEKNRKIVERKLNRIVDIAHKKEKYFSFKKCF